MPKKILFFTPGLRKGGAENQMMKLVVYLRTKGYVITIVSFVESNDFEEVLKKHQINHYLIPLKKPFQLSKLVRKEKPDLLISFMFGANIIARFVKLFYKTPLITSVRNNEISKLYYLIYKFTYSIDDLTTFNSIYALEKFTKKRLASKKRSILINNAIEVQEQENRTLNNSVFTLISIAHFRPQKDYRTLFKAIAALKKDKHKVKLYVLGHTYGQSWPQDLIKELAIEDEVTVLGFISDVKSYIDKADALVLSSLWEGTPNALLEAMANKLPIIASDIPGNRSTVLSSNGGVLFEKQNENDLAEKIIQIANLSESQRNKMAQNGFDYVYENYESNKIHKIWEESILNIIHKN